MNQYCVRWWWLHLPLLAAIWLAPQLDAQALPNEPCHGNYIPGEYLVKFNEDYLTGNGAGGERAVRDRKAMRLAQLAASLEIAQVRREYSLVRGLRQVKAIGTELRGDQVERLILEGKIEYAIPNCVRYIRGRERFPSALPNDPRLSELWGLNSTSGYSVNAPLAWNIATGSADIVVGVVDTGVDYLHEDLAANMWTNPGEVAANGLDDDGNGVVDDVYGYNAVNNSGDPRDDDIDASHGSHCAGTIGAVGNNGVGIVGVNWTTKIMALKFINGLTGSGSIGDELAALDYAATMKQRGVNLRVLSNSYGALEETFIPERQAIEELNSLGVLFVAAAGNEGNNNDIVGNYPSNYDVANIIAVAALNENGTLADFSNFGATSVDLGAPGVNILSTHRYQGYALLSGTSMATPHVAGVAALVLSQTPELTVAQLKDVLMDTVTPISSLSGTMVAPGMVNAFGALTESESLCSISGDTFTPPTLPSGDSDSDGVTDVMELSDGSDPSDPGSYRLHLVSPVYAPWTGFLGITGILELVNVGDTSAVATVTLYKIDGTACSRVSVSIDALGQRDLIINDMQGFETDSYGILKIEFTGNVDGRVFHYRSGAVSSTYDFAFGVPLANATFGNTAVSFNTFQPSLATSEQSNIVPNWLSIVNLSSATKSFSIRRYDQSGTLLSTTSVQVAARGRADIEAGHVTPGPGNVGVNVIVPTDAQAPYISFLTRFGYNVPPGQNPTGYEFAFPLLSRAGNGRPMHVPLSSTLSGQNWVEVVNTSDSSTAFDIEFRRSNGVLIGLASVSLPAHAQHHFDATSLLGAEQTGFATITPSAVNSIVAQSMFYVRNPSDGSVLAMYGSQAREAFGSAIHGSYNLYLGMLNWLKLLNPTTGAVTATVRVNHAAGSATEIVSVPAKNSFDLDIHNSLRWGTAADSYGVIEVTVAPADTLLVEDLRMRTEPGGLTDFLAPTEVR